MRFLVILFSFGTLVGCYSMDSSSGKLKLSNGFWAGVQAASPLVEFIVDEASSTEIFASRKKPSDSEPELPYAQYVKIAKKASDMELCQLATATSLNGSIVWVYYGKAQLAAVVEADERNLECGIGKPIYPDDLAEYYAGRDVRLPNKD